MDLKLIQKLIRMVEESDINGLKVEEGELKIDIKKGSEGKAAVAPVYAPPPPVAPKAEVVAAAEKVSLEDKDLIPITSPMVGTFYRAPSPDTPSFIEIGDTIKPGKVVCIIEAMKLFNEIEAEISGTVEKILVENAQPVEYGQTLMLVRREAK